jgi:hypothetical protein
MGRGIVIRMLENLSQPTLGRIMKATSNPENAV